MIAHFRLLTPADVGALADLYLGEGRPEGYEAMVLGAVGGVPVAEVAGGTVIHMPGGDTADLPGSFLAAETAGLSDAFRPWVERARWEPTSEGDPGYGPVALIPDGAVVLESGLAPNHFI